jgi:hypothetical protein
MVAADTHPYLSSGQRSPLSLGLDVSRHQDILATFEETQRIHTEHLKQLKQEQSILAVMIAKIATREIEMRSRGW